MGPGDPLVDAGRFLIGRRLGVGGMGVVFEAYDRHRGETVALKTLMYADGAAVYRLKREFRSLADVAHPNLVRLYELFAEDEKWFFTMELVEGKTFTEWVRPGFRATREEETTSPVHAGILDVRRLRSALRQLSEGVSALHAAGKIHRDLKPSNVLVDQDGRVVILDLGIARDLHSGTTSGTQVPGTAAYMSPEQSSGAKCTESSDWYSVGAMLYEALTGMLPFDGPLLALMSRKLMEDAPPVRDIVPTAPPDLAELADALLSREPSARPDGRTMLERLGGTGPEPGPPLLERRTIVGRRKHLDTLEEAFAASRRGRTVTVYVHGRSGMGKSTLVEHFLTKVAPEHGAVVLTGRCYDRESVPYKALDGVIDSLSHHLRSLPPGDLEGLLPPDVHTVARLFPVLRRVEGIAQASQGRFDVPDPVELRRRAIASLKELLNRISRRSPLVVHVDDLHWTDADSIALGQSLLAPPDRPPVLLLLSFRSEEMASSPLLRSFLERAGSEAKRELSVGPLAREEGRELAATLLRGSTPDSGPVSEEIAREAGGSPFFIEQLARHVRESEGSVAVGASLSEMLEARMERLPQGGRSLLRTLAVAGRPVDFAVACTAAGLEGSTTEARALLGVLRVSHLVRPSGRTDRIELYHDRIRATIAQRVESEEAGAIHRRLAQALTDGSVDDPEALFEHYLAAGEIERAGEEAARAARRASDALAFDRAVELFRQAIQIGSRGAADQAAWRSGLAQALANAGRPGEAAEAFMEAAEFAPSSEEAIRHRRSAAEWFLIGGHQDRGVEVTRGVLDEVGLRMPDSPWRVVLALLVRRVQIRLRGLKYELRSSDEASELDLLRMDICWACAIGLTMTDYIVAAYFQSRYMLLALETGEAHRVARALAFEVGFLAARGGPTKRRTERVAEEALALAEKLGSAREIGMVAVTTGSAACLLGDFRKAAELCTRAEEILRERCTGVQWELTTCQIFLLTSLTYLGQTGEIARRVPVLIEAATERGNLFEGVELRTRQNLYWLLKDDAAGARRELAEAMSRWTRKDFYRQDYNSMRANVEIDLYVGEPHLAWARVEQSWRRLRRSQLLRVQLLRCESLHLRARAAVAVAAAGDEPEAHLRIAERDAARIARERMPWSAPFPPLIRAGIAAVRGDDSAAATQLARAVTGFEAAGMEMYAAASRRRLGNVLGGEEGAQLVRTADNFMRSQAVRSPSALTEMLAPGFGG